MRDVVRVAPVAIVGVVWVVAMQCAAGHPLESCDWCHLLSEPASSITCLGCHDDAMIDGDVVHPVGIDYKGPELHLPPLQPGLLFAGRVECASCHDVHGGSLRVSMEQSQLCLSCHDK